MSCGFLLLLVKNPNPAPGATVSQSAFLVAPCHLPSPWPELTRMLLSRALASPL